VEPPGGEGLLHRPPLQRGLGEDPGDLVGDRLQLGLLHPGAPPGDVDELPRLQDPPGAQGGTHGGSVA
jgi:hypothetical protein